MASQFKSTSTFSIKPGDFEKHIKALQALDPENLSNVFRNALKAAGTPIAAEMRKLAPVGATGSLKKSIISEKVHKMVPPRKGTGKVHARVRLDHPLRKGRIGGQLCPPGGARHQGRHQGNQEVQIQNLWPG